MRQQSQQDLKADAVGDRAGGAMPAAGGPTRRCSVGASIATDLRKRLPYYGSDWLSTDGRRCTLPGTSTIISASLFAYVSSILPAVVIGDLLSSSTEGQLGLPEVLLSTGATGIIWALFGGQPLCIIGVTMPVAIFTSVCYILSQALNAPFLPWLGWICVFSGIMHILLSLSGAVRFVHQTTAFSCEIFGFFISCTYIYDALVALFDPILNSDTLQLSPLGTNIVVFRSRARGAAFANLCLAGGTYLVCMALHQAQGWRILTSRIRTLLSDYAAPIALALMTGLSYIPEVDATIGANGRLAVPDATGLIPSFARSWWNPLLPGSAASAEAALAVAALSSNATSTTEPLELVGWHIGLALVPALMLTALFFFDHNVSSKLAQDQKFHLKKPTAYHYDFSVLGLEVLLVGLVGVPPGNGLIPQAPLHTRALATVELEPREGGGTKEVFKDVVETRWSNLIQSLAVLCTVFALPALATIPQGCLDGVFLFLGMAGFAGNELWERFWLMATQKEMRRPGHAGAGVRFRKIRVYTIIQLTFVILVFVLAKLPYVAVCFPLLIAVLIPFRIYLLPRYFTQAELDSLDPPEEDSEEVSEHQKASARASAAAATAGDGDEFGRTETGIVHNGVSDTDSNDSHPDRPVTHVEISTNV